MSYPPIILPPEGHPAWKRADEMTDAFRAEGEPDPLTVAGVANAYAESAWTAVVHGDHDQSHGPWQMKFQFYGQPVLDALGIDIRKDNSIADQVKAVLWVLKTKLPKVYAALRAAQTGAQATQIWAADFERASAGGAVERRVAIAGPIEVHIAKRGKPA